MSGTPEQPAAETLATAPRVSNAGRSEENHRRLQAWLDAADKIPDRNGAANLSVICELAGVDRQMLYTSKRAKAMIAAAVDRVGLGMPHQQRSDSESDTAPTWARQRIKQLEEALAVAKAETRDLRGRLLRYEHLERHIAETGMYPR